MSLVPSLLQAIVHVDGEALVMHAGDKPYVVSPTGQVDLATRGLALDAVNGIVNQLLPPEVQQALDEFGAVQHELAPLPEFPGEHFTIVAARGGDDVWVEIRRRRIPDDDRVPEELFNAPEVPSSAPYPVYASAGSPSLARPVEPLPDSLEIGDLGGTREEVADLDYQEDLEVDVDFNAPELPLAVEEAPPRPRESQAAIERLIEEAVVPSATLAMTPEPVPEPPAPFVFEPATVVVPIMMAAPAEPPPLVVEPPPPVPVEPPRPAPVEPPPTVLIEAPTPELIAPPPRADVAPPIAPSAPPERPAPEPAQVEAHSAPAPVEIPPPPPAPAVVLPLARNPIRAEQPWPPVGDARTSGLNRLLRLSAARGASTMYLSSDSRPGVRVDGELQTLEGEPVLTARDVESLLLTLMPERNHEALRTGAATEWILDIEDVGRVRCMSFRDHRGPGGVFRLMPTRSVSVDQLGLPRAVQGLAIEPEGLVLVAGPRSSGKRTIISAFVDLINRTRRDHVITIEREINIVHERGNSFISQREVHGNDDDMLAAARAALREDPDVLVIEDLRSAGLMTVALEASASGHLVVGGFSAHTATATVDRIIDLYSPDHRRQVQLGLADSLRGVVVQVLLRKSSGGRVAAREVLLNTPAVSSVIAEGKTSQLPMAIEGGRRYGMMPLNDALVGLVQQGIVDGREAYRYASDRQGLLAALKTQGLDTSFVERLA